jgi:DNA-binding IclR family transcriptional regulator
VASVAKSAAILKAFTPAVTELSVRQVAMRTEIPRSTAHALCQTMAQSGLLEVSPRGYRLGPLLLELGGRVIERTGLVHAAEGILARLIRSAEAEAHLGQLAQGWIVYLDRETGGRRVPMLNRVGQRAPAHLTGCGRAAMSWLPFDQVRPLVLRCCAEERQPLPDLGVLRDELARARLDGYVVSRSYQRDRTSVAAAIFDAGQQPVGGVSIAGPAAIFTNSTLSAARDSVVEAARAITARLVQHEPYAPLARVPQQAAAPLLAESPQNLSPSKNWPRPWGAASFFAA